jgi:UDP-N-acetylglucosamine 2-epimerase (non-hydrolysing)
MSDVFFADLGMPSPRVNLEVGSGSHAWQTAQIMMRFEPVLLEYKPDLLLVPGDVNSTLACALVASKIGIKVVHLEAGLRSFDRTMPEEINRILTDQISDVLLTPSRDADENLLREGIAPEKIHFVGNAMIDTLVRLLPVAEARWTNLQEKYQLAEPYILVTLHRPANVDNVSVLNNIMRALTTISSEVTVLFPVHPRTRQRIVDAGLSIPDQNLRLIEPQGYLDFLSLQMHSSLVLTDSGGVQEETTYLGIPCLTARPNTERPVTITTGTNRLVDSRAESLVQAIRTTLERSDAQVMQVPDLWDGRAAERIIQVLLEVS